jgi:RNA polymerase sigma factor (sigma-70 family)
MYGRNLTEPDTHLRGSIGVPIEVAAGHNQPRAHEYRAVTRTSRSQDAQLLAAGDPDSFAEFYRRHARRLAGWLMRATGDAEVAADLTAETFAAALIGRGGYDPERGAPATWLYGIAANKLSDWRRRGYAEDRARRRLGMERITLADEDVAELERLSEEVSLVELLEELPGDQREALRARLLEGRAYAEIAGSAGVSEAVVRKRVSRGVAGLRGLIGRRG